MNFYKILGRKTGGFIVLIIIGHIILWSIVLTLLPIWLIKLLIEAIL